MNTVRRYAVAGLAVALGLGLPAQPADAALVLIGNGSGICRAADGVDTNFFFGALGVRNVSPAGELLSCNLPLLRESAASFILLPTGYKLNLYFGKSSATTQTVTCTATVAYAGQPLSTRSNSTRSVVLSATKLAGTISFTKTDLSIHDVFAPLNLSCQLPAGVTFGRVDQYQPELSQTGA